MLLTEQKQQEVIKNFGRHERDTGSPEVQIVLLTKRIEALNEHFKKFKKDTNSRRGFLKLIGQRRKLLKYLQIENPAKYQEIIKKLNLRK